MAGYTIMARVEAADGNKIVFSLNKHTWPQIAAWCDRLEASLEDIKGARVFYSISPSQDTEASDVS